MLARPLQKSGVAWEPWSEERVAELNAKRTLVYIDFTATWCVVSQWNRPNAYPAKVVALMKQKGIVALKADKTRPDPKIEAKLKELQRSAIPVNVLMVPGKPPIITKEILSAGYLMDLFSKNVPDPTNPG